MKAFENLEHKLDIMHKVKELKCRISSVIFVTKPNDINFIPRFIKISDRLGYYYYIVLNRGSKLKEIYSIKEERFYEVEEESYKLKLDKSSLNIVTKQLEDKSSIIEGILFECENGISYFSCSGNGTLPQEEVYIKSYNKKYLTRDNTYQVISFMVGESLALHNEEETEFHCPVAYPVIEISNFISESAKVIQESTRTCVRNLRIQKIDHEENILSDFDKNLQGARRNYAIFNELKTNIITVINRNISFYEKEIKAMEELFDSGEIPEMKLEEIRGYLRRCHQLIIDLTKTLCIMSEFNTIIRWISERIKEINMNLKDILDK
jgi:hypothetical protein